MALTWICSIHWLPALPKCVGLHRRFAAVVAVCLLVARDVWGCTSWRCGSSHRGEALYEPKDLGLFAHGSKLSLDGAAIRSSAVQGVDGKVYVAGHDGYVHAMKKVAVSNSDFWRSDTTAWVELWKSRVFDGVCDVQSTPVVVVQTSSYPAGSYAVIFACGNSVVAMDGSKEFSSQLWSTDLCSYYTGSAGQCSWYVGISSPVVSADSTVVYLCGGPTKKGVCFALKTSDGSLFKSVSGSAGWKVNPFPWADDRDTLYMFTSSPALTATGKLVVGTRYAGASAVIYLDASTGALLSGVGLPHDSGQIGESTLISGSPASWPDGSAAVCASDGSLLKFNTAGTFEWRKEGLCGGDAGAVLQSSPAILPNGDLVVAASSPPEVRRLTKDGELVWAFCARAGHTTGPCADGATSAISASPIHTPQGIIVSGGANGQVFAVTSEGAEVWRYATDETSSAASSLTSSPIVASDGTVMVGSASGGLHAVGELPYFSVDQPRLSVEVEVGGVRETSLGDGRLVAAKTAIAGATGGLAKSSGVIFVRVRVVDPGVSRRVKHGTVRRDGGLRSTKGDGRRAASALRIAYVVLFDSAAQQNLANSLLTTLNMTLAIRSALSASSVSVTIAPPPVVSALAGNSIALATPRPSTGLLEGASGGAVQAPGATTTPAPTVGVKCDPASVDLGKAACSQGCAYASCRCSDVGYCVAGVEDMQGGLSAGQAALVIAGVLIFLGMAVTCCWSWLFWREEKRYRVWRKLKRERKERKHARHEARRTMAGEVGIEDIREEDEEDALDGGWGGTRDMDDDD